MSCTKLICFAKLICFLLVCGSVPVGGLMGQDITDIHPDSWVATDALGRTLPDFETVGPVKKDHLRVVGIFYIAWHREKLAAGKPPYQGDVSKALKAHREARLDGDHSGWTTNSYHWGEPELGYFLSTDEYVIRKDMSMLADAGVDVLIMDVTNAVCYWDELATPISLCVDGDSAPNRRFNYRFIWKR